MTVPPIINLTVSESAESRVITVTPSVNISASVTMPSSPVATVSVGEVPAYAHNAGLASTASYARTAETASYAQYALGTAGLQESASFAVTASHAVSASHAPGTFPYVGTAAVTGTLAVTSNVTTNRLTLDSNNGLFVLTGSVSTGILGVTENINPSIPTSEFSGATIEYLAQRPTGIRIGMVMGAWSGSNYTFTDISATDIGDTSDLMLGFLLINDRITFQVNSAGSGSGTWTVQTLFKLFPKLY